MTLLGKIAQRRPAELWMAVEALGLLAFFRVCLAIVPVGRIIGACTHGKGTQEPGSGRVPQERSATVVGQVQWAVNAAARHSVVEFVCFPQSLAGYTMLRWRGVPSTIVYGVARSQEDELLAHTWLMVGEAIVLGGEEAGNFTAIERWG